MEQQIVQIQSKIQEIRGMRVMLDSDLAEAYGVETKRLKEQVRRNIERFAGDDFMFQLTTEEVAESSRSQIATLNKGRGYNIKYTPFAFTELGVAMLSSVLNSSKAIEINRGIMRAFVAVRQFFSFPPAERLAVLEHEVKRLTANIEDAFADYNDINEDTRMQLELINKSLAELQVHKRITAKPHKVVGFTANRFVPTTDDEA
ncbi:DNA-binding protein [Bacteroidia bacterium]|nr:DNA-binding protein [Bacteroidia bacterium]